MPYTRKTNRRRTPLKHSYGRRKSSTSRRGSKRYSRLNRKSARKGRGGGLQYKYETSQP